MALLQANDNSLAVDTENPKRLVHQIRSAFKSITELKYEPLMDVVDKYKIKTVGKQVIFFREEVEEIVLHKDFPEFDDLQLIDYLTENELSKGVEYRFPVGLAKMEDWIIENGYNVTKTETNLIITAKE